MRKRLPDWLFLAALWLPVFGIMELEWRYNEQYHYGYFVPVFTLYLLYLRTADCPRGLPRRRVGLVVLLLLLGFIPLQLIRTSNPDWRLIYWCATGLAFCVSYLGVVFRYGAKVANHLTPALVMIFFSVPWLVSVENKIMESLMNVVSAFTVEIINLMGIYAVQLGNVIRLPEAIVGVEEACSGVRSLQSSLMAGYLFGELYRMPWVGRTVLIALGVSLTFVLNLIRTLSLTLITHFQGNPGYEKWHDLLGNLIFVTGFIGIALIAWALHRWMFPSVQHEQSEPELPEPPQTTPFYAPIAGITILSISLIASPIWFGSSTSKQSNYDYSQPRWALTSYPASPTDIHPIATAQLKYSIGKRYDWSVQPREFWTLFYFEWDSGTISSHAGVHRPENCLPATGLSFSQDLGDLTWQTPDGYSLDFKVMQFDGLGTRLYVFFIVWDEGGKRPWYSLTAWDRILDTLHRRTVDGRHSIQILVEGVRSPQVAKEKVRKLLDDIYPATESIQ
jgi:exosortase